MDRCKRGHPFIASNVQWIKVKKGKYRACKICKAARVRLRYKNDPEFRARLINTALKFYYKKKAEKQNGLAEVSG